ncbi:MAG: flagellar protein [Lachnoclostridium sp.]|nr:flagellar protein [Lachnoclostridium sp.]
MNIHHSGYSSMEQVRNKLVKSHSQTTKSNGVESTKTQSFGDIFRERQAQELRFSKHASERLETRNINITDSQKVRLEDATVKAKEKGINESLVMVDNLAFIVNVKSNTVVTAVNDMEQGIFTNIDGAIIN